MFDTVAVNSIKCVSEIVADPTQFALRPPPTADNPLDLPLSTHY